MDWSLIEAPAAATEESGFSFGSFFKEAGTVLKESGWTDTLNESLQKGVSRYVDAEVTSQFRVNDAPPLFANENGQGGVAGRQANTLTAPTITVIGKQVSPLMLAGGVAAVLLVLVLVMRR
jgi:hypothetical protein